MSSFDDEFFDAREPNAEHEDASSGIEVDQATISSEPKTDGAQPKIAETPPASSYGQSAAEALCAADNLASAEPIDDAVILSSEETINKSDGAHGAVSVMSGLKRRISKRMETTELELCVGDAAPVVSRGECLAMLKCIILQQHLLFHTGPIWCVEFNHDNTYCLTAGQDTRIAVWKLTLPNDSATSNNQFVSPLPIRVLTGHAADVNDLSLSKHNFVLSASSDKTVRLWHVSKEECLAVLKHNEYCSSVAFHPEADQYCFTASHDRISIWDISRCTIQQWTKTPERITSGCFSLKGDKVIVGLKGGRVFFYRTEGLKYYTEISCRNHRGKNRKGRPVVGLHVKPSKTQKGSEELLVSTNDSRLRVFNLDDFTQVSKYKGHTCNTMPIKARFARGGKVLVCGSEDGQLHLWNESVNNKNDAFEYIDVSKSIITSFSSATVQTRESEISDSVIIIGDYEGRLFVFNSSFVN